ncbi:unnamed protein product [Spirodela intermedia]|uniref:PTC1-like winged helix-turn-helix domain-containing protein n=1 Tax=Spirodela intermedia TaxID=51605 RepID=A0A7I8J6X1_SPIIN|nr:unnamed protein product [Spirodela intermedia]CAA6665770.1 unnamed protein product [Spirodela intermedia]
MFEVGMFYEIDHGQLLPKSPIHLKDVRVVKVSEKTRLNVTVSFPSAFSLRKYFGNEKIAVEAEAMPPPQHPELDEQFVMGFDRASKILSRLIPSTEVEGEAHLERFWLVAPKEEDEPESIPLTAAADEQEEDEGGMIPAESCLLILKRSGRSAGARARHWGCSQGRRDGRAVWGRWEEEDTRDCPEEKRKKEEKSLKKAKLDRGGASDRKVFKAPKDRWSSEREGGRTWEPHTAAGAEGGSEEAYRDTGLLDHLLKHMAGKVVSEGKERFRRRHNPEGAMEYWLEAAELQELRRTAGMEARGLHLSIRRRVRERGRPFEGRT